MASRKVEHKWITALFQKVGNATVCFEVKPSMTHFMIMFDDLIYRYSKLPFALKIL